MKRTRLGLTKKRKKAGVSDDFHSLLDFKLKSIGVTFGQELTAFENQNDLAIYRATYDHLNFNIAAFDISEKSGTRLSQNYDGLGYLSNKQISEMSSGKFQKCLMAKTYHSQNKLVESTK